MDAGTVATIATLAGLAGLLYLFHRWTVKQADQRDRRARMIYSARADERRAHPSTPYRRVPVEKPPALAGAPIPKIDPANDQAVEHHAAEGIAAAQFMLDRLWKQKGHDR